jgi:hypothetical protein
MQLHPGWQTLDEIIKEGSEEAAQARERERRNKLVADIRKDINDICCIYRTVGEAMFEEARQRLAERIATRVITGKSES